MSMFTAEYQDFKREDPTVLVKVTLYDDQKNVIKPVISKAKLVQGTKYAGDYEITQDGDQYCLSTKQIAKLPSGSYGMELWGDDGSIYPSAGFIPIRIHRNADDSLEQVDPTVDLNKIIEDMHNAGLNLVFDKIELLDSDQPGSITSSIHDGKNHITLRIPRGLQGEVGPRGLQGEVGPRGFQGPAGKNFQIKQTFESIEAMNASKGAGFEDGDFALISSNIEDPDNSKLYVWNGSQFDFLTDMSGAQGIQGPTGPKGDKGDTGTVDNAGLTTAPAFVSLQTQVNNSAVGTNLLTGTSSDLKTMQLTNAWNVGPQATNGDYKIKGFKGQTYTYRAWLDNTNGSDDAFVSVRLVPIGATTDHFLGGGGPIDKGEAGYSTLVFTPTEDGYIWISPFSYDNPGTALAGWKEEKLEKGSVATDWCPNPADVPSNDSQLVHNTGNETIAGDKTLVGNTTLATTTILAGNYGLRVTTSGIQKTTDGKTWVPANI